MKNEVGQKEGIAVTMTICHLNMQFFCEKIYFLFRLHQLN
jgi:hypothetical protein